MTLMSSIFNDAIRKGLATENPVRTAEKPREPEHRERTASERDIQLLLAASGWDGESVPANSVQMVMAAFLLSCRTGMRSGEMLRIERPWIDGRVIHLPADATKTGSRRDVALGLSAMRILELILAAGHKPAIFGLSDQVRDQLWRRVRDRAGLGPVVDSAGRVVSEGLNFHDARATFCTWAASPDPKTGAPRLDVLALARQTGHRNLRMLQRYYRATAEQIADRLE
jgi:integrase